MTTIALMAYAHVHDVKVISITTLGPSLEDVFIQLTGLKATGKNAPPGTLIPGLISITLLLSAPISLH